MASLQSTIQGGAVLPGDTLHTAAEKNDVALIRELLDKGHEPHGFHHETKTTALHVASANGNVESMLALIDDAGADVNAADEHGSTPLHEAAHYNRAEALKLLVAKNATLDLRDKQARTPLFVAAFYGHAAAIKTLAAAGAHLDAAHGDEKLTPVHIAARNGMIGAIDALVEAGADLEKVTVGGLHAASVAAHAEQQTTLNRINQHRIERASAMKQEL